MSDVLNSLDFLYPDFKSHVEEFQLKLKAAGLLFFVFETFRTYERTLSLWQQGREFIGNTWVVKEPYKIVTKAQPGFTYHEYGLAVDMVYKDDNGWSWDQKHPWSELGRIGKSIGLEWAGDWTRFTEQAHFQMTYGMNVKTAYSLLMTK